MWEWRYFLFNKPSDSVILFPAAVLPVFKFATLYFTASDGTKAACLWNLPTEGYVAVKQRVLKLMDFSDKVGDKLPLEIGKCVDRTSADLLIIDVDGSLIGSSDDVRSGEQLLVTHVEGLASNKSDSYCTYVRK